ncbi:hypothetical protein, conserved [Leishmania tarentolae]|uniref:Uncharacterized protein n=1 Tax=Leishmania tarentolae TaxID=5689 RepID=A0A640KQE8_LEITA|nr:hypothetical protein, conserved [Leishmania tarentolae]
MGTFSLCVESAARDIRSILVLHRVHPQVRTDVQRVLGSLLRKHHENMASPLPVDEVDAPEKVCQELVHDLVKDIFKTALPASDMRALERRCAALQQDNAEVRAAADKAEKRVVEMREMLSNLKRAHEYMLHSYFKEVLMLRCRIDDLQRQSRARRLHAMTVAPLVAGSVAPTVHTADLQLQHFLVNAGVCAERRESVTQLSTSSLRSQPLTSGTSDEDSEADNESLSGRFSRNISLDEEGCFADVQGRTSSAASGTATADTAPLILPDAKKSSTAAHLKRKCFNIRINIPSNTLARARKQRSPHGAMTQRTTSLDVWSATERDSVDAIFDYEEYLRILNGGDSAWDRRFKDAADDSDRGSPTHRRHSVSVHTRMKSKVRFLYDSLTSNPDDLSSSAALWSERPENKGFRWLLHLALEPIKHEFHMELDQLREAVITMQREHADQVSLIQDALVTVQSRNNALLDFIIKFAQQTRHTLSVVARDVQARNMVELLSNGELPVSEAEAIASFFTLRTSKATPPEQPSPSSTAASQLCHSESAQVPSAPHFSCNKQWRLRPDMALRMQEQGPMMAVTNRRLGKARTVAMTQSTSHAPTNAAEEVNYYRADLGIPYWRSHPVTLYAQKMFRELQEMASSIRATRAMRFFASGDSAPGDRRWVQGKLRGNMDSSSHDGGDHHALNSPPSLLKDQESAPFHYFSDLGVNGDSALRYLSAHRRLREEWLKAPVTGAGGQTAKDLLGELAGLRMRRACDQKRLLRAQAALPQHREKDAATSAVSEETAVAKGITKETATSSTDAKSESSHLHFCSPEELLRDFALKRLGTRTQERLMQTSQRITELQHLLDLHCGHWQLKDSEDSLSGETARRVMDEESQGLLCDNDPLKLAGHLWRSPYLNDILLDANDQKQQHKRDIAAGDSRVQLMYVPIGRAEGRDADGNSVGGAGAYFMLDGSTISAAPFAPLWTAANKGGEVSKEESDRPAMTHRITPFVAVMDYCRGVQMGRPLGQRAGPVYLFQDHESGDYYVGDQAGRKVLKADTNAAGETAGVRAEADTQRPLLPMTRILFPAPTQSTADDTTEEASSEVTSGAASAALRPIYLVPMAIPLSDEEAVIQEGWQACHRHGHTRSDPVYYTTTAPLPLSTSYHHAVPQPGNSDAVALAETVANAAVGAYNGDGTASVNRYFHNPPCVFQPADEASAMMRVRSVQLQQRQGASKSVADTVAMKNSAGCAHSDSPSPDIMASSTVTPTSVLPSSVSPLPGYALSPPELHVLGAMPLLSADWQGIQSPVEVASLPGSSSSRAAAPLATCSSTEPDSTPAKARHDSVPPFPEPVLSTSAAAVTVPGSSATGSCPRLTAALVRAKERRNARIAVEAERAEQAKMLRQVSLRNQTLTRTTPNKASDAPRILQHRLVPLSSKHPGDEMPSMLPLPADSAKLQKQMCPAKHSLMPLPPSSRWREMSGGGLNAWNLNIHDGDTV